MISTIIFDLSEVYLQGLLGVEAEISKRINKKVANDAVFNEVSTKFFHGQLTEEDYWTELVKKHNWNLTTDDLKKIVRSNIKEIDGTREIIEKLQIQGIKLGLLSIHAKEWITYAEQTFDFHKLFHSIIYSFEVGISKPDKRAYELILDKLKAKPEECLFIDDSKRNLVAAQKLGIQTIHFVNAVQLKEDLKKFEIFV